MTQPLLSPRNPKHSLATFAVLGSLLALGAVAPFAMANHESNIQIRWTANELDAVVPAVAWSAVQDAGKIGCAGTARLTLPGGGQQTVVGVALGSTACTTANPPCAPWNQLSPTVSCTSSTLLNPVFLTVPASASGDLTSTSLGCLKEFFIDIDANGDHIVDSSNGPFFGFASCTHWGE